MTSSHRRSPRCGDDTGSLPFALLLGLVGMALTALVGPLVLTQVAATRGDMARIRAVHAAQAGLDAAMEHIRATTDAAGNGRLDRLPCSPLAGGLGGGDPGTYRTEIHYLTVDPSGREHAWVTEHDLSCPLLSRPKYAWLRSTGTDGVSESIRTLEATYTFRTVSADIRGGQPLHDIGER